MLSSELDNSVKGMVLSHPSNDVGNPCTYFSLRRARCRLMDLLCHYKEDNCVLFPLLQGPQGPPGSIGSVGGVGEKVRNVVMYSLEWQD